MSVVCHYFVKKLTLENMVTIHPDTIPIREGQKQTILQTRLAPKQSSATESCSTI